MSKIRIQVMTIESDSADPEVMLAIRKLLRRVQLGAPVGSVSVVAPAAEKSAAAVDLGRSGGLKGGPARAASLSAEERSESGKAAADARWGNREPKPVAAPPEPVIYEPPPEAPVTGRTEHAIRDLVEAPPVGPVTASPMLEDRILAAIESAPGVTAGNLTMALLGSADGGKRRRVDMLLNTLQMAGKIMRANGQLFAKGYRGGPAAPALSRRPTYPGTSDAATKERAYSLIQKAFTANNAYPIPQLATECFGDASGSATRKVKLMLAQLVANEKLERISMNEWRPWTGKGQPDLDDDGEEDTESNGQTASGED